MESLDSLLKEELSEGTLAALQEFLRDQKLGEGGEESKEGEEGEGTEGRGEGTQNGGQATGRQEPNTEATLDPLSSSLNNNSSSSDNTNENSTSTEGRQGHPAGPEEGSAAPSAPADVSAAPGDVSRGGLAREEARFRENWGLSQFWYEDATAEAVAEEVLRVSGGAPGAAPEGAPGVAPEGAPAGKLEGSPRLAVACIACPTLFRRLRRKLPPSEALQLHLLEYDRRFADFGPSFTFYDYRNPEALPGSLLHRFPVVVADPPYLSEECLEKTAVTMRLLAQEPTEGDPASAPKLLLLTGAVQEPLAKELLGLRPCKFRPEHRSKLGNDFRLFTNYEPQGALGGWEPQDEK